MTKKKNQQTKPEEIVDIIRSDGFAILHTAMRKAVDGDGSGEIWRLMSKMSSSSIESINDFMIACLVGYESPLYKKGHKKVKK